MISRNIVQAISKAEKYPHIVKVGVFGSCARDEETTDSDIDILIDYDSSSDDYIDNLDSFMEEMEHLTHGVKIDYITLPGLMKSGNESIRRSILRDVKWVYTTQRHSPL